MSWERGWTVAITVADIQVESKADKLQTKLAKLEDNIDSAEFRLSILQRQLSDTEKQIDESSRTQNVLVGRAQINDAKLNRLQCELEEITEQNKKYEDEYSKVGCISLHNFLILYSHCCLVYYLY